jgi:hypothetical protein
MICSFFLLPQNTYSSSKEEDYKLQERCGKYCDEMFKREFGNGLTSDESSSMISSYQNHYNKKLNKCFILVKTTSYLKVKKRDVLLVKELVDINENKFYGSFSKSGEMIVFCNVSGKECKSEQEWDKLVKPYMEE